MTNPSDPRLARHDESLHTQPGPFNVWHAMGIKDVFDKLGTSQGGLTEYEANARLARYGANELKEEKKISPLAILLRQFKSLLIVILMVAAVVSVVIESWIDSVVIIIIVILNAVLGFRQEYSAEKAMEALKRMASPRSLVIRHGRKVEIESRNIVPGDIVVLEEGTKIPADMRLFEASVLKIDEASLTGESVPVNKAVDPVPEKTALADRKSMAFMGTAVTTGRGLGVAVSTGMGTEMGSIARMVQVSEEKETPLQRKLGVFGKNLGVLIMVICAFVIAVGVMRGEPFMTMFITGIALAVAAVPEGLPAIVTITLAVGLKKMAEKNAIVRKLAAVETLGCTTIICSDKTGTLTRNEMVVSRAYAGGRMFSVTGEGYKPEGQFAVGGKVIDPLKDEDLRMTLQAGALCNNAELRSSDYGWEMIGDPTEGALLASAAKAMSPDELGKKFKRTAEMPFSSERKMMSVLASSPSRKNIDRECGLLSSLQGEGYFVFSKGAVEVILGLCTYIMKSGRIARITERDRDEIHKANAEMSRQALRVLAFAYKQPRAAVKSEMERDLVFLGLQGMIDLPREEVKQDIEICRKAGIDVVMITGDHRETAVAIARQLSIMEGTDHKVLTGQELDGMPESRFLEIVESVKVYARVNPLHKLKILKALQQKGHVVAMTGDGVNDSPALKGADIGVSMGIKGTDVAKESSDMILKDDNFSTIVAAIERGRAIYDNIMKFIQYLLSSNLGEVLVVFIAMMIGFRDPATGVVLIPVTAIQLLWINLMTDGLPAVALGLDPPAKDVMKRRPRNPKENILSRRMLADIVIVGAIICIGTLLIFNINIPEGALKARTAAFTMLVVFEMVRVQSVRMKYRAGLFSNMKLIYAMAFSIVLQLAVIYALPLQAAFGTVALGLMDWVEIIAMASTVLVIMWVRERVSG